MRSRFARVRAEAKRRQAVGAFLVIETTVWILSMMYLTVWR